MRWLSQKYYSLEMLKIRKIFNAFLLYFWLVFRWGSTEYDLDNLLAGPGQAMVLIQDGSSEHVAHIWYIISSTEKYFASYDAFTYANKGK